MKLAIITTHPIQYYAPLFQLLNRNKKIQIKVFYTWGEMKQKFDPGFGKTIEWDIPLLDGYEYTFVDNVASRPGSSHFFGIKNPTLINEISEWKANAILIFGWAYQSHLQAIFHFKQKIPVYFRGDSTLLDENKGFKSVLRFLFLSWVYRSVDYCFYVGSNNKKYFLRHGLKENQLIFCPHAVDNNRFEDLNGAYQKEADKWRKSLGIPGNSTVILFVGKFEPKKDPKLLLQATIELNNPDLHLILIGNGILENELKEISVNFSNIHFVEFQNQSKMPVVYRLGDLLCLPSKGPGETWGLAINEAMACGLGIIASNKCGCAIDLVENGVNGYQFEAGNLNDLKSKIISYTSHQNNVDYKQQSLEKIKHWNILNTASSIEQAFISTNTTH